MLGAGGYAEKTKVPQPGRGGNRNDTYLRRKRKNEIKSISYTRVLVWELSFVSLAIEGNAQK
jgi:hypothetical protein